MSETGSFRVMWVRAVAAAGALLVCWGAWAAADPSAQGKQIATKGTPSGVPACASCHGARGEGAAAFPRLAATGQAYLGTQLDAFASGSRQNAIMQPFAQKLTAPERAAVAAYFASLPAPVTAGDPATVSPADAGAWLATRGRWADQLPACAQCHGPGGRGVGASFPPLAGLPAAYLAAQLKAWQAGTRPPGPLALMQGVAKRLGDGDINAVASYYAGLAATAAPAAQGAPSAPVAAAAAPAAAAPAASATAQRSQSPGFQPPPERELPAGEYGKVVRYGEQLFVNTSALAKRYVGNDLNCANCHLDAGRQPNSAPMWAAFVHYPAYRAKTGKVDTLASRLQGCFEFSMNGKAPAADDPVITALQTYAYWLATGAPVGKPLAGSGYPKLAKPQQPADYARGEKVYAASCALCHGPQAQGQRVGDRQVFPPLWGPRSFNWGAGMHQLSNASAFIKANMPLGQAPTLSDQEAWDVAYFMDAHERPPDPRFKGSIAQTRKAHHDTDDSLYGVSVNGRVLGAGTGSRR